MMKICIDCDPGVDDSLAILFRVSRETDSGLYRQI